MSTVGTTMPAPGPDPEISRLGMWIFLAGEALFFGVVMVAYGVARSHAPTGFALASGRTNLWLGTLNTALLLVSSAVIALAAEASVAGRTRQCRRGLLVAAGLGLCFLAIKGVEYHAEWSEGLFPGQGFRIGVVDPHGAELFFAWYFVVTSLHAVHLTIGIVYCGRFARPRAPATASQVHALGMYWHFVDIVWIFLYPLIYLVAPRT